MKNRISFFNEIYDKEKKIRMHYMPIYSQWKLLSVRQRQAIFKKSDQIFSGDYYVDPLPRIITSSEFSFLKQGVEQRAKAILAFLCDYYGMGSKWKKLISPLILKRIIARDQRRSVLGKLKPQSIAFPYGPDIIRDQTGKWRVVEDSTGMLGGIGDLLASRTFLRTWLLGYKNILSASNDPLDFFKCLSAHYQSKAKKKGGIALLYLPPFRDESDHEDQRLFEIFKSLGIECILSSDIQKRLLVEANGIYLRSLYKKIRVGYLILHSSPEDMDAHRLSWFFKGRYLNTSREVKISLTQKGLEILGGDTLKSSLLKQQAWTNFSPGVEFVNDKEFGTYVDSLIRFYLKEEPLLESIPSCLFVYRTSTGRWRLDTTLLNTVMRNKNKFVVKRVDEDGGQGVWVGQKRHWKQWAILKDKIRKDPEKFIVQKFEHLSVLENRIVDLRIHTHVDYEKIITSNTPWGRANWIHGDGKVNLSSNGFTSPVITLKSEVTEEQTKKFTKLLRA